MAGQDYTDVIDSNRYRTRKKFFRCEYANVQALSGSPMNQAVYLDVFKTGRYGIGHGFIPAVI